MSVVVAIVGILVGGSIVAMLTLFAAVLVRRLSRRRLEGQAERIRKLLAEARASDEKSLDKLLFEMRDTFNPEVLDAQIHDALAAEEASSDARLILAVSRIGFVDRYMSAVREAPGWRERARAAHALGALGEGRAAEALVLAMRDPREDRDVKLACAEALGRIRDPAVIGLLCAQLGDVDEWASPRVAAILTRFGDAANAPLLGTLEAGENLNARVWAAQILGKIKARDAVPALRDRLHDRSEQMRISAANALGEIGDVRAVRSLIDVALRDPTSAVRAQAAQSLGKLGDPEALPILVTGLGDPEYWMRFRALEAIEELGPKNLEPVELALGDSSPEVRRRAALALERLGLLDEAFAALDGTPEEAAAARERLTAVGRAGLSERFVRHLNDSSARVRENTAHILGDVGDPGHASELERHLTDDDGAVRRAAARALGFLAVESTAGALIGLLDDDDAELAAAAVEALHRFGGERLVNLVEKLALVFSKESDRARVRAAEVLADIPGDAVDELLLVRGLGDRFAFVRLSAVRGLGRRRVGAAVDSIGALLSDPFEPLRVAAAEALSEIGGERAVDLLLARMARAGRAQREAICKGIAALGFEDLGGALDILLGESDLNARIGATWVLGNTGSPAAIPLLAALLRDSEPRVRSSAAGALSKIPGELSFQAQRDAHDDPNQFVRAAVVNAIGARGSGTDIPLLAARALDPDDYVRDRAVVAAGRLGGVEGLALVKNSHASPPHRVLALGLCGDPAAIGDAMAALEALAVRAAVAELVATETAEVREAFVVNLGLAHAADALRAAFASSLEPSPLIAKLVSDLRNHNAQDARLRALRTLGRLTTKDATLGIAAAARHDPSEKIRVSAVGLLGERLGDGDAIAVLRAALADPEPSVRAQAIAAIGRSGDISHRDLVLGAMTSERAEVAAAAVLATAALFAGDAASFAEWFGAQRAHVVIVNGLAVFAALADPAVIASAIAASTSPEPTVRVAALTALAAVDDGVAARALLERIADPDPSVRRRAVKLAPLGVEALAALKMAARDPDIEVRGACASRLGERSEASAIGILEALAQDQSTPVRAAALAALLGGREPERRRAFVRAAAEASAEALAIAYRDEATALAAVASDASSALTAAERILALEVLLAVGSLELADDIAAAIADPDPDVRLTAARGLAALGVDKLDDRLRALASDPVAAVRAEVRRLLIRPV